MNPTRHLIINGDSRTMNRVADQSVQLIITSPPYWQLKDYGEERQIGFHQSYEEYINNLNLVWAECFRVLENGCRLCINVGDQFARSVYYGRYKVIPIRTEIIRFCETLGMDYLGAVIWQKNTTMNTTGGGSVMGSFPYPRNGILKLDYEFILIFKKLGKSHIVSEDIKKVSAMTKEEWNTYFSSHWTFGGARQDKHMAVFPEELPRRLIKMFSFVGETVLDPFLGSGTTSLAAKNLGRNSVGYEIKSDYIEICRDKIGADQEDLSETDYDFKNDTIHLNLQPSFDSLPYIFSDPHGLDKKVDVKKLQFGSKIDNNKVQKREKYYTVKKIITSELIGLSNDLVVKLIGVKENISDADRAKKYLTDKILGQKVFLRYDDEKYDKENRLQCYLYLKNKTFINAHLIKLRLADADCQANYKYQSKFIKLEKKHGTGMDS